MEENNEDNPGSDQFRIYNVKVKGPDGQIQERKSIDAVSLLQWMATKESESSVLTLDLDKVPEGKGIDYIQAKISTASLTELKVMLQEMLGLIQQEQPTEDENESVEPEVMDKKESEKPEPKKEQPKPEQPKHEQPSKEAAFSADDSGDEDFNDDEVVL